MFKKKDITDSSGGDLGHACFCLEVEQPFQVIPVPACVFPSNKVWVNLSSQSFILFFSPHSKMEGGRMGMRE